MAHEASPGVRMKTIIKLAVTAVILTVLFQATRAAIRHYVFVDALQEALLFASNRSEDELVDRVMEIAGEHEIPLDAGNVSVRREPFRVVVDASYTADINLLPGVYRRDWPFDASVSVRLLEDSRPRSRAPR
jgi:hypothetical protein